MGRNRVRAARVCAPERFGDPAGYRMDRNDADVGGQTGMTVAETN
jgi:hypothetical protein